MKYKIHSDLEIAETIYHLGNVTRAAAALSLSRQGIYHRLKKYNFPDKNIMLVIQEAAELAARQKREIELKRIRDSRKDIKSFDSIIQKHISSLVKARLNELKDFDEYRNFAVAYFAKISDGSLGALHKRFKDERVLRVAAELKEQQERYNA